MLGRLPRLERSISNLRRHVTRLILPCVLPFAVRAQQVTRDNYYDMIPPKPPIVGQTGASAALYLYGNLADSGYRDVDPVDGIDDSRARRLMELAERFSPILRRNNASVPRDAADVLGSAPILHVDTWEQGRRVRSDSIALGPQATLAGASNHSRSDDKELESDKWLASLIASTGPRAAMAGVSNPDEDAEHIFFFDMPGHDPASWIAAVKENANRTSRIFAHPLIHEERSSNGDARYQLVFQFWLFYPLNTSVNNHEGDWEHINALVTTRARAAAAQPREYTAALLTGAEIERLLDPSYPADSTIIAAVEYHFHHHLLTLDYLARRMVSDDDAQLRHDHGPRYVWEDLDLVSRAIDARTIIAGGRLATHPLVYVGGDYKGPAELLALWPRFHDSYRRNSHGSYPFPGTWQTVGPLGLTEQVHGEVVPEVRDDPGVPWDSLITDGSYVTYRASDILLLPDWERLEPIVLVNADARRRWAWMLLPVHWGFPAVASLGAGTMKHVNLGNVAPLSPPYQPTWNRVGPAAGRTRYVPRILRTPVSPTTPWALLNNGWGVLNVPLAVWGLMPGYNVALIEMMPWIGGTMHIFGAPPARTYTSKPLPHRFTTEGQGVFWEFGGRDFASMLAGSATGGSADDVRRSIDPGARAWLSIYFHDRFALENTLSLQSSTIKRAGQSGTLEMRQLTGGVRYSPFAALDESIHLYVRGGYGWLWYAARDLQGAAPGTPSSIKRGYLPTILPSRHWWPNTWYGGAGVEMFSPRQAWLLGRLGYGLRIESSAYVNKLSFNDTRVFATRGDLALSLIFGW